MINILIVESSTLTLVAKANSLIQSFCNYADQPKSNNSKYTLISKGNQ